MPEEIKRKVKFLRDYEVQDERAGTAEAEVYKRGKQVALGARSALHFVTRGIAEFVDGTDGPK